MSATIIFKNKSEKNIFVYFVILSRCCDSCDKIKKTATINILDSHIKAVEILIKPNINLEIELCKQTFMYIGCTNNKVEEFNSIEEITSDLAFYENYETSFTNYNLELIIKVGKDFQKIETEEDKRFQNELKLLQFKQFMQNSQNYINDVRDSFNTLNGTYSGYRY